MRREKDWKLARICEHSSRESTSLVYLTNKVVAVLWLLAEQPDTYRERDLFLVFRIAKAFAEDTLSRSLARRWINLPWHSFSRMALMTAMTERERERARHISLRSLRKIFWLSDVLKFFFHDHAFAMITTLQISNNLKLGVIWHAYLNAPQFSTLHIDSTLCDVTMNERIAHMIKSCYECK